MYQILVADDHPIIREAISNIIQTTFKGSTVGEASCLNTTMEYIENNPDTNLILLDLNISGMDGLNGIVTLQATYKNTPVVIFSGEKDKQLALNSITYGALGFISKFMSRVEIIKALKQTLGGDIYLPPPDIICKVDKTAAHDHKNINRDLISSLTRRQLLVFHHIAKGKSNKEISYDLNIAETTVKAHVSAILSKLNVHSRLKAILYAKDINFDQHMKNH